MGLIILRDLTLPTERSVPIGDLSSALPSNKQARCSY